MFPSRHIAALALGIASLSCLSAQAQDATPGVLVRIYDIQENMGKLFPISAGQLPNVARIMPTFDLRGKRGDFAPYTKKFMTVVSASLEVTEAGSYSFRLGSDDGSALYINGEKVIDHDGLHGPDLAKEVTRDLAVGIYKLRIKHFEYGGGEQITLEWKPPGANAFTLIPTSMLSVPTDADRDTAPGKKEILRPPARPRPGDGMPLEGVHPSFDLLTVDGEPLDPVPTGERADWIPLVWPPNLGTNPRWLYFTVQIERGQYAGDHVVTNGPRTGLLRSFPEGGAVRFTQGLATRVARVKWGEDGAVHLHSQDTPTDLGRLMPTERVTFEIRRARLFSNGIEIEFTKPIAEGCGQAPEYYFVLGRSYGEIDTPAAHQERSKLIKVQKVSVSTDRKRTFLQFQPGTQYLYIRILGDFTSKSGERLWSTELWFHSKARSHPTFDAFVSPPPPKPFNVLTAAERSAGWRLLFDGKTTEGWRGFRKSTFPEKGWAVEDGCLMVTGDGGGDIVTEDQFDSFELSMEWRVSPSANSGIFYHVTEEGHSVWLTGPEMQVLDNGRHPDGRSMLTSAGSNYALHAPPEDNTKPVGLFNEARILVDGSHVEYHLNGHKQCEFELGGPAFKKLVAGSKFKNMPMFATKPKGHIALQDHGDKVWYRNIKIRPIVSRSGSR